MRPRIIDNNDICRSLVSMNLETYYASQGLPDNAPDRLRIAVLDLALGGKSTWHVFGGKLTDGIRLRCLELQWLAMHGLIQLELA